MKTLIVFIALLAVCVTPADAELMLFAKYEWQDGARDVSGSPLRHDGLLDPGAVIENGKLVVNGWDGVHLGQLPELGGATFVLFRFDNITFTKHGEEGSGATSNFVVLTGDNMNWWAALRFDLPPYGPRTALHFDLGGFDYGPSLEVMVAENVVDHFDSIEYRFEANAPTGERLAVRWNEGPWVIGGEDDGSLRGFPPSTAVCINNGLAADWDEMWGSLGPVSFYSDQIPEPSILGLLVAAGAAAALRHRTHRMRLSVS